MTTQPADEPRRPRVAVVFGGRSSEHAISCVTAGSVLAALDPQAWDVVPVGITTDGRWVLESGDPERLRLTGRDALPEVDGTRASVSLVPGRDATDLVVTDPASAPRVLGEVDVVLPLLHGPWGEDGTLQGMLEMGGVRYVGAGVLASAVSMDKAYMKIVLAAAGLPVTPGTTVTRREWDADPDAVRRRAADLAGDPGRALFVKPARGGSSIGISKVPTPDDLDAALAAAFEHDPKVLVEVAVDGAREVECGVLGRLDDADAAGPGGLVVDDVEVSVPAEVRVGGDHDFYDFAAKYLPEESTELDVPAHLDEAATERVQRLAARAFAAVGSEGLARVDFFVLADGEVLVNEINTMPGFTPTSMFPRMWDATGLDYPALLDRLLRLALARGTGLR